MDGDEPAGDWATSHDSVHDVLVNKKSNAMLVFILFSTEENLRKNNSKRAYQLAKDLTTVKQGKATTVIVQENAPQKLSLIHI